jgi:hypothetical protein
MQSSAWTLSSAAAVTSGKISDGFPKSRGYPIGFRLPTRSPLASDSRLKATRYLLEFLSISDGLQAFIRILDDIRRLSGFRWISESNPFSLSGQRVSPRRTTKIDATAG